MICVGAQPHAMLVPLVLLTVVAPIGALDILYFHLWKFRLHDAPSARGETATHLIRGAFLSGGAHLLANYRFGGLWFWSVGALFVLDFINELVDVVLEPGSRAPLGGLPPAEYLIHIIGATFGGGIAVAFFLVGWGDGSLATELLPVRGRLPDFILSAGEVLALGGASLTTLELGLFVCSLLRGKRTSGSNRLCAVEVLRRCCARD